jgi:hypothetical protein
MFLQFQEAAVYRNDSTNEVGVKMSELNDNIATP